MALNFNGVINKQNYEQSANVKQELSKAKDDLKKARGYMKDIAKTVCSESYSKGQLGAHGNVLGMSDREMRDFIIDDVNRQVQGFLDAIVDMQNELITTKNDRDSISRQYIAEKKKNEELEHEIQMLRQNQALSAAGMGTMPSSSFGGNAFNTPDDSSTSDAEFDIPDNMNFSDMPPQKPAEPAPVQTPQPARPSSLMRNEEQNSYRLEGYDNEKMTVMTKKEYNSNRNNRQGNQGNQGNQSNQHNQHQQNSQYRQHGNKQQYRPGGGKANGQANSNQQRSGNQAFLSPQAQSSDNDSDIPTVKDARKYAKSDMAYIDGHPYDVAETIKSMTSNQEQLLIAIGTSGKAETDDIFSYISKMDNPCVTNQTDLRSMIKKLIDMHIIRSTKMSTSKRPNFSLFTLSELGHAVFYQLTGNVAPMSEPEKIKQMHATLRHGYHIKDTATTLKSLGYTSISMNSKANGVSLGNGLMYVPDVTAVDVNNAKTYWEIELAHHHDEDMADKLAKAAKVTSTVYVVTDKKDNVDKLRGQVFKARARYASSGLKLVVYVGTLQDLINRKYFAEDNRIVI